MLLNFKVELCKGAKGLGFFVLFCFFKTERLVYAHMTLQLLTITKVYYLHAFKNLAG